MKLRRFRRSAAFTHKELVVTIILLVIVSGLVIPWLRRSKLISGRICCNCNLKQIGTAYRIWEQDHFGRFPVFDTNAGWNAEASITTAGAYCWTNYVILGDNLGASPLILVCPADEREPASAFSNVVNNAFISYFVGVLPGSSYAQGLLGGDRNLGSGFDPKDDYGFSPEDGNGNSVTIQNPVCWSLKMHSGGKSGGMGNILLGDGSAQQIDSKELRKNWIPNVLTTAQGDSPWTNLTAMRIIFP